MTATATVKGGFWPQNGVSSLTQSSGVGFGRYRVSQLLGKKGLMHVRARVNALLGAAAGSNATKTLTRVAASSELGGKRTIETETLINRNTTAGDDTELTADLLTFSTKTYDSTPVPNKDGNPLGTR